MCQGRVTVRGGRGQKELQEKLLRKNRGQRLSRGKASITEPGARSPGCGCLQLADSTDTSWNAQGEAPLRREIPLSLTGHRTGRRSRGSPRSSSGCRGAAGRGV